ncbi:tripartite tricarboxylate transporter substrate binding protein [Thalassococcus profundi]|uniref:Tripartite tricarboxylate transporter substrate binding protein n=1 Tax=Thalassococcus profundi TaxID=2282382 RepID=A0A369TP07_9RHOB|nr:tripartite tricarboxylate transporter substrate binding protein [Thalassococcus profundi]RDD65857.1 tripartite tricarboxylate transporter substrate binding protein [Thalassococcus profundi]
MAASLATLTASAAFGEYPERPIEMIVAYSAGGGTDTAARTLAPFIEKYLGNDASVVVVNKPGAGGEIGFTDLARADPDGYTIVFINTPNILTIPISRDTRYTMEDIQAVSNVVYDPGAFNVRPGSEFTSLDELVAYAKENPGAVTYGTSGTGGDDHLAALQFSRIAGIEMTHVPFPGAADVRAAVLGGHITMAAMNISEAIDLVNQGELVSLGQMDEERWDGAPDVPTFAEQGYEVVMGSDRGIGAPAGIPEEALNALQDAIAKTIEDPEFLEAAENQKLPLAYRDAAGFQDYLGSLGENLQQIWDENPWVQ